MELYTYEEVNLKYEKAPQPDGEALEMCCEKANGD